MLPSWKFVFFNIFISSNLFLFLSKLLLFSFQVLYTRPTISKNPLNSLVIQKKNSWFLHVVIIVCHHFSPWPLLGHKIKKKKLPKKEKKLKFMSYDTLVPILLLEKILRKSIQTNPKANKACYYEDGLSPKCLWKIVVKWRQ